MFPVIERIRDRYRQFRDLPTLLNSILHAIDLTYKTITEIHTLVRNRPFEESSTLRAVQGVVNGFNTQRSTLIAEINRLRTTVEMLDREIDGKKNLIDRTIRHTERCPTCPGGELHTPNCATQNNAKLKALEEHNPRLQLPVGDCPECGEYRMHKVTCSRHPKNTQTSEPKPCEYCGLTTRHAKLCPQYSHG